MNANAPATGRIAVATLLRPRGNKGELAALPLSDRRERFSQLSTVFIGSQEHKVEKTWWHGERLIFKLAGVDSIDAAEALAGRDVELPPEERILPQQGEYFLNDLVGFEVFDPDGGLLGAVTGWEELPGQVLLQVGGSIDVPFTRGIFINIDVENRRMTADLPRGLRELNQPS